MGLEWVSADHEPAAYLSPEDVADLDCSDDAKGRGALSIGETLIVLGTTPELRTWLHRALAILPESPGPQTVPAPDLPTGSLGVRAV